MQNTYEKVFLQDKDKSLEILIDPHHAWHAAFVHIV